MPHFTRSSSLWSKSQKWNSRISDFLVFGRTSDCGQRWTNIYIHIINLFFSCHVWILVCPVLRWSQVLMCGPDIMLQCSTFPSWWCVLHNQFHTRTRFFPPSQNNVHWWKCIFLLNMDARFGFHDILPIWWMFLVVVYQNLLELLLLALVGFLRPSLSGVLGKHTHRQRSPWMKRFSINQPTPDLKSNQVISLLLFSQSLSPDKSPHRKCDSLFQFINDARPPPFISSTSTDWFEADWFSSA